MTSEENAKVNEPAPAGLTRGQVAERLGVAVATVRRLEGKRLHPRLTEGVWLFDPVEVAEVASGRCEGTLARPKSPSAGAVAAAVFRLFDAGRTFREIVQLTAQPPDAVRALHREWRCGFSPPSDDEDDEALARVRDRDERELSAWEARMLELGRREDEYDLRSRNSRLNQKKR